jgi:Hemerythrin HHE cation binding domain
MAEHLSMNTVIHAAVRRDLQRFSKALEEFPVGSGSTPGGTPPQPSGSRQRAAELDRAWQHLDHQLYHHHHSEETIFWPALREAGADETLVGDLGGEHDRMAEAMARNRGVMTKFAADPSAGNLEQAKVAFADLTTAVETHFVHEERDLEPFQAQVKDSPPMRRAAREIRRTQTPAQAGGYLAWLQDGADPGAQAFLRQEIPAPVLLVFSRLLGRSYTRRIASTWR